MLFAGSDEAALVLEMLETSRIEALAAGLAALGVPEVFLKHGAAGASTYIDDTLFIAPAVDVDVVDIVGAGDAFVADYLSELLVGAPVQQRLATATLTGAFACRHPGH